MTNYSKYVLLFGLHLFTSQLDRLNKQDFVLSKIYRKIYENRIVIIVYLPTSIYNPDF